MRVLNELLVLFILQFSSKYLIGLLIEAKIISSSNISQKNNIIIMIYKYVDEVCLGIFI